MASESPSEQLRYAEQRLRRVIGTTSAQSLNDFYYYPEKHRAYTRLVNPEVGLAIADWLVSMAEMTEYDEELGLDVDSSFRRHALAVASLIAREESDGSLWI